MKKFTSPDGVFEIGIPIEWDYKNEALGYESKPPFSFESFKESPGCFQVSHYINKGNRFGRPNNSHDYFQRNLKFSKDIIDENDGFIILLWGTIVKDFFFMAKYIYEPNKVSNDQLIKEVEKVEASLKTLICIDPDTRVQAVHYSRYEKFNAALAATFDLKLRALESGYAIEVIILNANRIDAYLRLSIILKLQIREQSDLFHMNYLFQDKDDKLITEKSIYKEALDMKIITNELHEKLFDLYNERNKIVHRYIITDIKTLSLFKIAEEYEQVTEQIRLILSGIEREQFDKKVGYFKNRDPHVNKDERHVKWLKSLVNEKHFLDFFYRNFD